MELKYIRTDKNGTQIFHDWNCQRCGGRGGSDNWKFTGWTCHECGGTGQRRTPKTIKKYTPEHEAKLAEKAHARFLKKQVADNEVFLTRNGFSDDGVGYVFTGDTYAIKDALKSGGAKWNNWTGWIAPAPINDFPCVRVEAKDLCNFDGLYRLDMEKCFALKDQHLTDKGAAL